VMVGGGEFSLAVDLGVIGITTILAVLVGTYSFKRMQV